MLESRERWWIFKLKPGREVCELRAMVNGVWKHEWTARWDLSQEWTSLELLLIFLCNDRHKIIAWLRTSLSSQNLNLEFLFFWGVSRWSYLPHEALGVMQLNNATSKSPAEPSLHKSKDQIHSENQSKEHQFGPEDKKFLCISLA